MTAFPPVETGVDLALLAEQRTRENLLTVLLSEILGTRQQTCILCRALRLHAAAQPDPRAFLEKIRHCLQEEEGPA